MTENVSNPEPMKLPAFKKENYQKLMGQLPQFILPFHWKDTFEEISYCWKVYDMAIKKRMDDFSEALALPNIPDLEKRDANEYLQNTKNESIKFIEGVDSIVNGDKLKWRQIKELAETADSLVFEGVQEDDQAIALLRAISKNHNEGMTPEKMRQRIAQSSFDEIFQVSQYRTLEYTALDDGDDLTIRTTQDIVSIEENELQGALNDKMWNSDTVKERHKSYLAWRRVILDGGNSVDTDLIKPFEELWKATKGEGVSKKSALHLLGLAEEIFQGFEDGEAFDIDISEYIEEGDGDSEEDV